MELSIIIVNYNTDDLTKEAINSVIKNTHDVDYEIIVVDNSSQKSTLCCLQFWSEASSGRILDVPKF